PFSTAFDPEFAKSYEVGLKAELFERRVRTDLSLFHADYTDLQVRTIDPVFALATTQNAGEARSKGVELQLVSQPLPSLTISANGAWQRAEYTSLSYVDLLGVRVDYRGNLMNNAPEWQFGTSVEYSHRLASGAELAPRIDATYRSRVFFNETNDA